MLGAIDVLLLHSNGVPRVLQASVQEREADLQRGRKTDDVRKFVRESADLLLVESHSQEGVVRVVAGKEQDEKNKSETSERDDAGELLSRSLFA